MPHSSKRLTSVLKYIADFLEEIRSTDRDVGNSEASIVLFDSLERISKILDSLSDDDAERLPKLGVLGQNALTDATNLRALCASEQFSKEKLAEFFAPLASKYSEYEDFWHLQIRNLYYSQRVDETRVAREKFLIEIKEGSEQIQLEQSKLKANLENAIEGIKSTTNAFDDEVLKQIEKTEKEYIDFSATVAKYREQEKELDKTLRKASQVGLEASFDHRARTLFKLKWWWAFALFASLALMMANGIYLICKLPSPTSVAETSLTVAPENFSPAAMDPSVSASAPAAQTGHKPNITVAANKLQSDAINWGVVVARALITLPLIWAAWFSAKQFGYTSRLEEDYAFKVAVARSYLGYKKEATDVSKEMEGLLLELSLKTFSDNPLRIYNITSDAGTPFQEIANSFSKMRQLFDGSEKSKE